MLAVGEQVLASFDRSLLLRAASAFAGGVGRSREDMCGALAGGVMVIGLLCGRESAEQDDAACLNLAKEWRQAFLARFGTTCCRPIYDAMRLPGGPQTCAGVAGDAAVILLGVLEKATPAAQRTD